MNVSTGMRGATLFAATATDLCFDDWALVALGSVAQATATVNTIDARVTGFSGTRGYGRRSGVHAREKYRGSGVYVERHLGDRT